MKTIEQRISILEKKIGIKESNSSKLRTEALGPFGRRLSSELGLTPSEYNYLWVTIEDYMEQYGRKPKVKDIQSIVSSHPKYNYNSEQISELIKYV